MNVYFDGSVYTKVEGRALGDGNIVASFGVVIDNGAAQTELMGSVKGGYELSGMFEVLAFGEALLWLDSHQVEPTEVSFYGDDQTSIYGALQCGAGWVNDKHYRQLLASFRRLMNLRLLPLNMLSILVKYTSGGSRFHKVKGHRLCVNNNRCDYLAKTAARKALGVKHEFMDFEAWLDLGFSVHDSEQQKSVTWHPATFKELQHEQPA